MNLLPLGTVLKVRGHEVLIMGYTSAERGDVTAAGYVVVPYPLGFTNVDKSFFIPHDEGFEVVAEGYATPASTAALAAIAKSFELAANASYEDLVKIRDAVRDAAEKKEATE